jgi:hypothetical protein
MPAVIFTLFIAGYGLAPDCQTERLWRYSTLFAYPATVVIDQNRIIVRM